MADIELIGVPFDGHARCDTKALVAKALHDAGLAGAFDHHHVIDRSLDPPESADEAARRAVIDGLTDAAREAVAAERFPFVYGGDAATIFGVVTRLGDLAGDIGLVFIDGHEANVAGLPISPEQAVVLGPREQSDALAAGGVWVAPLAEVADDPVGAGRRAIAELARRVGRWWLHIDLDVLDPVEFPAQGSPPDTDGSGGLTWEQLTDLVMALFGTSAHCVGGSIAVYDPDRDPEASGAAQIVTFIRNALSRTTISP